MEIPDFDCVGEETRIESDTCGRLPHSSFFWRRYVAFCICGCPFRNCNRHIIVSESPREEKGISRFGILCLGW